MKKNLVLIITIAVVAIGGLAFVLAGDDKNSLSGSGDKKSPTSQKAAFEIVKACEVLTVAEAKKLLGEATTAGSNTPDAKSGDVNVSTCSYSNNAAIVADIEIATVTVRSALSDTGAQSNKAGILAVKNTDGAQSNDDFGDEAYFIPATGQLNILDGNNWIIVSQGGANPATQTLDKAKEVAHQVLDHHGDDHDSM